MCFLLQTDCLTWQLATERRLHARVGTHLLGGASPVFIVLVPLPVQLCTCTG